MNRTSLILRCYARPEKNYVLGICIDLNIAVRGASFAEVKQKMTEAVDLHFSCLTEENFQDLRYRPAPMKVQFEYLYACLVCNILKLRQDFHTFCEQLQPLTFRISTCA